MKRTTQDLMYTLLWLLLGVNGIFALDQIESLFR